MEDMALWKVLWGMFVTGATGVISFFGIRTINGLDDVIKESKQNIVDLERFKTDVATNYVREASLARLYQRMDDGFDEIRSDIKALLGKIK